MGAQIGADQFSPGIESAAAGDPRVLNAKPSSAADSPEGAIPDDLLPCLQFLAQHFERPSSDTVLTAGLPLDDGRLPLELFATAAARVGLSAKRVTRSIGQLAPFGLPAVILTASGRAAVLLALSSSDRAKVFAPDFGAVTEVSRSELERSHDGTAFVIAPLFAPADVDASRPRALAREHWFFGPLLANWRSFVSITLAAMIVNLIGVATPLFALNVYDRVLPNKAMATLWVLATGFAVALVFDFVLKTARALLLDTVGKRLDITLSSSIFEKIMNTPLAARANSTGEFVNRIAQYEFIREFFTANTITLFVDTAFVFVFVAMIYALSGWIVVIPLATMAVVLAFGLFLQHLIGEQIARSETESSLRHAMLVEAVGAIETIKTMRAEGQFLRRWDRLIRVSSATQERIKTLSSTGVNVALFFQQLVTIAVIVAGAYRFSDGQMTTGAIIAAVMLSSRAVAPLTQIALTMTRARYARAAVRTLNAIMSLPDERVATESFVTRPVEKGAIEFKRVTFSYPLNTRRVLDGINLSIRPGEKVGVIGKMGSGKTTLARLIVAFYAPVEGEVLVDGVDVRQYHPHELRRAVSLVMQDTDLFVGSIKANIMLARPDASDAELIRACQLAGVDEFVALHPLGYDLPVGERGRNLSTGQKQAVALARAFLTSPKILFLDEPSSAMDLATERAFLARLQAAMLPDQTLLIATHRYSMLSLVDRLIVIDNGRIVADGPKERVLDALKRQGAPASA